MSDDFDPSMAEGYLDPERIAALAEWNTTPALREQPCGGVCALLTRYADLGTPEEFAALRWMVETILPLIKCGDCPLCPCVEAGKPLPEGASCRGAWERAAHDAAQAIIEGSEK